MIITIIVALFCMVMLQLVVKVAGDRIEKKNQEIAKLERLRRNDAWEIDFMEWNIARLKRSEGRAVEEYQKLANRKMYCLVRGRSSKMNVSIGYMVGYRCEALPLGFIIDFKGGMMTDKATGEVYPLSNR